jgi:hypothetical protein
MSYSNTSLTLAIFCNQLFCQKIWQKLEFFNFSIFGKLAYELPKRILILKKSDDFFFDFFIFFLKSSGFFPMTSKPQRVKYSF